MSAWVLLHSVFDNLALSNNSFANASFIPVYGDVRFLIPTGLSVRPFIGLRAGMTIPTLSEKFEGGFYGSAVAGLEYKNFTFGAGFKMNVLSIDAGYVVATTPSNPLDQTLRVSLAFDMDGLRDS